MKAIFITAGFGKKNFGLAAQRLCSQVSKLEIFESIICVDEDMLKCVFPTLFETYSEEELLDSKGFGYYSWQAILVNSALEGYWGEFELVVYMDAGCEVLPGRRTVRIFKELFHKANETGCVAFAIETPELQYSKSSVVDLFPPLPVDKRGNQIQSGTLFLSSNDKGRDLAREWAHIVGSKPEFTNDFLGKESSDFVAHRHAQSVFSLMFKTKGFTEEPIVIPYPRNSFLSKLRAARYPIWWARNTSGETTVPFFITQFMKLLP